MNCEIKYQAWDKDKKEMFQVERIDLDYETGNGVETVYLIPKKGEDDHPEVNICNVELREFTGKVLEDKTEIYDGDLIEAEYVETLHVWAGNTHKEVAREKILFKVEKRNGCFGLVPPFGPTVWFHELWGFDGSIKSSSDYCSKHRYDFDKTYHRFTSFKKVGTIFENPELLEG
ncbi:YopX family protein [Methanobacterium paludis]|uniref:YopX protein n=1 Tax=Methanobacterium paludis (strain DSM 25820 / JCM 18151 / SWAN1) TaxID=868131 RepID=F6D2V3_METPW|nr:YopX family protein [Methanobacterium paludis]AEG18682.1 YopX protein [Methanobacterium paludis]